MTRRAIVVGAVVACACYPIAGCTEVEQSSSAGYEPSKVVQADGGATRVTFTDEGVRRTDLQTAPVRRRNGDAVVPYSALLYDADGQPMLYEVTGSRTFARTPVEVEQITGDRVRLRGGPRAGTHVVTVGAAEVYGAELGIEGGH